MKILNRIRLAIGLSLGLLPNIAHADGALVSPPPGQRYAIIGSTSAGFVQTGSSPTWTGTHTFTKPTTIVSSLTVNGNMLLSAGETVLLSNRVFSGTPAGNLFSGFVSQTHSPTAIPIFTVFRASGTKAAPLAVGADMPLGWFHGKGYDGTEFPDNPSVLMSYNAAEAHTPSAKGTYIEFDTTPIGSTTRTTRMTITDAGDIIATSSVTASAFFGNGAGLTGILTEASSPTWSGVHTWSKEGTAPNSINVNNISNTLGSSSVFAGRRAFGTAVSSTTVTAGGGLVAVTGRGYDGDNFNAAPDATISLVASETFTDTSHPTHALIRNTPSGSVTAVTNVVVTSGGVVGIGDLSTNQIPPAATARLYVTGNILGTSSVTASGFFGNGSGLVGVTRYAHAGGFSSTLALGTTFFAFVPDQDVTLARITVTVVVAGVGGTGDIYRCQDDAGNNVEVTVAAAAAAGTVATATGSGNITNGNQVSGLLYSSDGITSPVVNVLCEYLGL